MDIKKEVLILVVALVYSIASLAALPSEGSIVYVAVFISSFMLGLASGIFLLGIILRIVVDKIRKERKIKEFEHLFEGASPKAVALMVGGIILTTIAFLNPLGMLSFFPLLGMLAFIYGFYRVFPMACAGLPDNYAS